MVTGGHEGMVLLIFGVSTLAQLIQLAQELTSTAKIAAWLGTANPLLFLNSHAC